MPKDPTKKPRILRKKKIMRQTGSKSQAKQISALSTQVNRITRQQTERIRTCWQRNVKEIGNAASAAPFILPLPYAPCDVLGTSPVPGSRTWFDNVVPGDATQPSYSKRMVFGHSEAAANSNLIYHVGGVLRYQIYTTEPSYSKCSLFLIRPKKSQANQLVLDRKFQIGGNPGQIGYLTPDIDFTVHDGAKQSSNVVPNTTFGAEINRKYWDVLYKREIALAMPGGTSFPGNVTANASNPKNNALCASGTIKLPACGECKNVSQATQTTAPKTALALEMQYLDQTPSLGCYLVAIHNDVTIDNQVLSMGCVVTDYYKAVV